jgi:hypothetical protein
VTALAPAAHLPLPTDLPDPDRPGVTIRYHVGDDLVPEKRAAMVHPAETVVRRPRFAKRYCA